jgi:hypothetical protein
MLIQEEQITFLQNDFLPIDDVRSRALAHIDELDKIVRVAREMHEAHMRTDVYELSILQNK